MFHIAGNFYQNQQQNKTYDIYYHISFKSFSRTPTLPNKRKKHRKHKTDTHMQTQRIIRKLNKFEKPTMNKSKEFVETNYTSLVLQNSRRQIEKGHHIFF